MFKTAHTYVRLSDCGIWLYATVTFNRFHLSVISKNTHSSFLIRAKMAWLCSQQKAGIIKWHAAKRAHQNLYWIKAWHGDNPQCRMHENNDNSKITLTSCCFFFLSFKQLHVLCAAGLCCPCIDGNRRIYALAKAPPPPRDGKDGNPYAIFGFGCGF